MKTMVGWSRSLTLQLQAMPNPMIDHALLRFDLPQEGAVNLRVYDSAGRLWASLVKESLAAGSHQRLWNATDDEGQPLSGGIYFLQLETPSTWIRHRMVVIRQV